MKSARACKVPVGIHAMQGVLTIWGAGVCPTLIDRGKVYRYQKPRAPPLPPFVGEHQAWIT